MALQSEEMGNYLKFFVVPNSIKEILVLTALHLQKALLKKKTF